MNDEIKKNEEEKSKALIREREKRRLLESSLTKKDGELELGRWQSCMFAELDGPRSNRKIIVTVIGDKD